MTGQRFDHGTTGEMMREIVGDAIRMQVPPGTSPASREAISAWVAGVPAPQGSKRPLGRRGGFGKTIMVEQNKRVAPWRQDVREAFLGEDGFPTPVEWSRETPVVVKIVFVMPRTKAMRNRPSADFPMVQKPDVDKLQRAVLDALTSAGVYADDSQVVACYGFKRRAEPGEATGAMIHVEPYTAFPLTGGLVQEPTPAWLPVRHRLDCPARYRNIACACGAESVAGPLVEGVTAEQAAQGFERFSRVLQEGDKA